MDKKKLKMHLTPLKTVVLIITFIVAHNYTISSAHAAETFDIELTDSFDIKTGFISFETTGEGLENVALESNTFSNYSVEASRFHNKIVASYFGFRAVYDPDLERIAYNSAYLGVKYYFNGLGVPIRAKRNNSLLSWDIPFKPYVNIAGSTGRLLLLSLANDYELSSQFVGVQFGAGFNYTITENIAFDFNGQMEMDFSIGAVDFQSTLIMGLLGAKYYF